MSILIFTEYRHSCSFRRFRKLFLLLYYYRCLLAFPNAVDVKCSYFEVLFCTYCKTVAILRSMYSCTLRACMQEYILRLFMLNVLVIWMMQVNTQLAKLQILNWGGHNKIQSFNAEKLQNLSNINLAKMSQVKCKVLHCNGKSCALVQIRNSLAQKHSSAGKDLKLERRQDWTLAASASYHE